MKQRIVLTLVCAMGVGTLSRYGRGQPLPVTLGDFWHGQAAFVVDQNHGPFGASFGMHFLTTWWLGGTIHAYYIESLSGCGVWPTRSSTGLAITTDGTTFSRVGTALPVGPAGTWDDRLASFPGVWRDGPTWYIVYEGADCDGRWPGDIGLASSPDGIRWTKDPANPILQHQEDGWERVNIGTPSLWKEGAMWYLFYHGYDGTDVRIGVAVGPDLQHLTRYQGNPVLSTGSLVGAWDAGTVGKRSIRKEEGFYYMVFEGSTDKPFDSARWSSGIARSADLLHWEKWPGNPVIPQTSGGFGFDGPEWIQTPDGRLHIYFRHPTGATWRATLCLDCNGNDVADDEELDRRRVYIDRSIVGCENGSASFPFDTVSEGKSVVATGGTLYIVAGVYAERLSFDRAVRLEAVHGIVRIGG